MHFNGVRGVGETRCEFEHVLTLSVALEKHAANSNTFLFFAALDKHVANSNTF